MEKITMFFEKIQWQEVGKWLESTSLSIVILIFFLSIFGIFVSDFFKGIELPKWAKINPSDSWGENWDKQEKLKVVTIKLFHVLVYIFLFIIRTIWLIVNGIFNFFGLSLAK